MLASKTIDRISPQDRSDRIENLFNPLVKSNVDAKWRLQNQLERTNIVLGSGDQIGFINSVVALRGDLPLNIKQAVIARVKEYVTKPDKYTYEMSCHVKLGTIENPLVRCADHPEWGSLQDIPDTWKKENPDKWSIWSPIKTNEEVTSWTTLFEIIKEEIEKGGVSWQHVQETKDAGKIPIMYPKEIISLIVKDRVKTLLYIRKNYPDIKIGYQDMNTGWDASPPTPTYPKEAK